MNMKKLVMMAMGVMLLAACKKDSSTDAFLMDNLASQKNGGKQVTRPMKIDIFSSPNPDFISSPCLNGPLTTSGFFVNGTATHLGKIDAKNSPGEDVSCNFVVTAGGRFTLETEVAGQITAANGDLIKYIGSDILDLTDIILGVSPFGTIVGTWTITGGTGRFVDATGTLPIKGIIDASPPTGGIFRVTAEGTITY